jgi:multiple antibiotic resistance protein
MFQSGLYYTHFLVALLAVLDPFIAIPVFLTVGSNRDADGRRKLARAVSVTVFGVLAGAALVGETILHLMGTSLAAFRLGGGLVLLLMALAMLHARTGDVRQTTEEANLASQDDTSGALPIAIPLLAGPGAISTVMIAANGGSMAHQAVVVCIIGLVCLTLWLVLVFAESIARVIGNTGFNVINRLLGLLLTAIAFESMAMGLKELFPVLAGT